MSEILCPWEAPTYFFFSSNVPALIHYSHAVAVLSAVGIGILIFTNNPRGTIQQLFILFVALFSSWVTLDVVLWATNRPDVVMFSWALQVLLEPLTYTIAFYLFYIFLYKKLPSFFVNIFIVLLFLPVIILLPTTYDLEALSLSSCEAVEGPLAQYYTYLVHTILMIGIVAVGFKKIPSLPSLAERWSALYFGIGLVTFLLAFSSGNIIGSFTDDWTLSQYGLFAMPIFSGLIAYSIVRFKAFNAKVMGAQLLIIILALSVLSLVALQEIAHVRVVAMITFVLVCVLGLILVRSVKREIEQRERIESLAKDLEKANERLRELDKAKSEFLSIASHQLRTPLSSIRGYVSLITEGDFGSIPEKIKEPLGNIQESARLMNTSIEDYLNVSRIEQGRMKYEMQDLDLVDLTKRTVEDLQGDAKHKNLTLSIDAKIPTALIYGDLGKLKQLISNLIDNSIKYTPQGGITVSVEDSQTHGMVRVTISDTGVGIPKEEIGGLFEKFTRAKGAGKVNTTGTGLGLYVAKSIVEAHKGKVWVESDGPGKGSRFFFEVPKR
jgi:signal transduction histidine kinase